MSSSLPLPLLRIKYEEAAEAYLRSLPPEHFMEATSQATQRKITLESFDLIHAARSDIQLFSELLVQYPLPDDTIGQVVPDNMAVVSDAPIDANGSFDVLFQPVRPFLVLEYVSKHNRRKDYEDNFRKYEKELKVPYYLLFVPDAQELTLFRRNRSRYVSVKPNAAGRLTLPELELEVAILDGWVRFWFRGELLPLPADLQRELTETRQRLAEEQRRADQEARRADQEARRADQERDGRLAAEQELAQLRAQLDQLRRMQQPGS